MSFELGVPISELRKMSADDLTLYRAYTAKRMFPSRRAELLMAQASMLIAKTMGGAKNVTLQDFLFDPVEEKPAAEMTVEEIRASFGFNPVKLNKVPT